MGCDGLLWKQPSQFFGQCQVTRSDPRHVDQHKIYLRMTTEPLMDLSSRHGTSERHPHDLGIPTQLLDRSFPIRIKGNESD